MSHGAVMEYIRAGRSCGLTDHDIAARLEGAGWTTADVEDAFVLIGKLTTRNSQPATAVCPPDNAQRAPSPNAKDRLLSDRPGRTSSLRYAGWIAVALIAFFVGFSLMR